MISFILHCVILYTFKQPGGSYERDMHDAFMIACLILYFFTFI